MDRIDFGAAPWVVYKIPARGDYRTGVAHRPCSGGCRDPPTRAGPVFPNSTLAIFIAQARCWPQLASSIGAHPSRALIHAAFAEPRPSLLHPGPRRGHTSTDRDRVDDVPGQTSTSAATILPVPKNRDPVPAPAAAALPRIHAPCRSPRVRLRPSGSQPSGFAASHNAVRAEAMLRDGRSRTGWLPAGSALPLVDRLLPARGRHRGFFEGHNDGTTAWNPRGHRSTRSRSVEAGLGWKAGASDSRAEPRWYAVNGSAVKRSLAALDRIFYPLDRAIGT